MKMKTKTQHYVPQFILKNFSSVKNMQIWAYDKQKEKMFKTNILNIAAENNFYDIEIDNAYSITYEPGLAEIETKTSNIIAGIIQNETLNKLTIEDKVQLSYFFALQFVRTKHHRLRYKDIAENLWNTLKENGYKLEDFKKYKEISDENIKSYGLKSIANAKDLVEYFLKKDWILFKTTEDAPFYISDNPIAMQNLTERPGSMGLGVVGIELYFPLSKTLSLAMFCRSHKNTIDDAYKKLKYIQQINPFIIKQLPGIEYLKKVFFAYDTGNAMIIKKETVENHNYLQVWQAERFVFSCDNNFNLVKDMIKENSNYKMGPRSKID
jgi:hypothetical protein